MEKVLENLYDILTDYSLRILAAIAIFVIGKWISKLISKLVTKSMTKANMDATLINFMEHLSYTALLVFVIISALGALGIKTAQFVAIIGAAGLAVGLALQGSLSNFAAGVLMLIFKPFKIGDFVEISGTAGTVASIQIFNTILTSPDNVKIIIPNSKATGDNIKNYSVNGTRRVDLVIGVSYEDDLNKAQKVILDVINSDDRILKDPAPVVAVFELADSSVNFVVRPWTTAANYWAVYFDLTEKIKLALDANDITIPFPQRDIHLLSESTDKMDLGASK